MFGRGIIRSVISNKFGKYDTGISTYENKFYIFADQKLIDSNNDKYRVFAGLIVWCVQ